MANSKEYNQRYYQKNRERLRVQHRQWSHRHYWRDPERSRATARKSYIKNRDRILAKSLVRRYGISQEEYDRILESQAGVCALCKQPETRKHSSGSICRLAVDHDHKTGTIRGLLCNKCNRSLGQLGDSPEDIIERLTEYINASIIGDIDLK